MIKQIVIAEKEVLVKKYRVRPTGKGGATIETTIPKEVFCREARRLGLSFEEALKKLVAVWRYNSFRELYLSFELEKGKATEE